MRANAGGSSRGGAGLRAGSICRSSSRGPRPRRARGKVNEERREDVEETGVEARRGCREGRRSPSCARDKRSALRRLSFLPRPEAVAPRRRRSVRSLSHRGRPASRGGAVSDLLFEWLPRFRPRKLRCKACGEAFDVAADLSSPPAHWRDARPGDVLDARAVVWAAGRLVPCEGGR